MRTGRITRRTNPSIRMFLETGKAGLKRAMRLMGVSCKSKFHFVKVNST